MLPFLNELVVCAADYREYRLVGKTGRYQDLSRHGPRFRKKIDFQMRPQVFPGSSSIILLSFLAKLRDACSPSRVLESVAVWRLQFYVEERAESLLLTRLTPSLRTV